MVDEDELEELRKEKMEELSEEGSSMEDQKEQVEKQREQLWTRAKQYMTSDARDRLSNVKVADEELAMSVAQQIMMLGQSGQIGKVSDQKMKQILKSIQKEKKDSQSDIKFRK